MVHMPGTVKGKAWKFARAFYSPYRIITVTPTNAEVRLVDKPDDDTIFVALDRLRSCPGELKDISWTGHSQKRARRSKKAQSTSASSQPDRQHPYTGPTTRSRAQQRSP